jgi:hypothetical protein
MKESTRYVAGMCLAALVACADEGSLGDDPEVADTEESSEEFCAAEAAASPMTRAAAALERPPSSGPTSLAAVLPAFQVRIHAVRLTDDNGGRATAITRDEVRQWVDFANQVHSAANIRFLFDAGANSADFVTVANTAINSTSQDPVSDPDWPKALRDANDIAARHPNKIVILFRHGPGANPTGGGFSWSDINFVMMPGFQTHTCGSQNLGLLAHELGHYLGLPHTFAHTFPGARADALAAAQNLFAFFNFNRTIFDGDGVADTDQDPLLDVNGCDQSATSVTLFRGAPDFREVFFRLPRENIMSYYSAPTKTLSPDQATIENNIVKSGAHFSTGARFQLIADHTGKCLDIGGAAPGNGAPAVQWDCLGMNQTNQHWRLVPMGGDLVQIVATHTNKCLDVGGASGANGAPVVQWDCLGEAQTNQLWRLVRRNGNIVSVKPAHTGKCLDVSAASTANGAAVVQWDCLGAGQTNQHWRLRPIEPDIQIIANHSGKCVDVAGAGTGNGADVVQYQCFGADAGQQLWRFVEVGQGRYNVVAKHSNRCMEVGGVAAENGADVIQFDCLGPAQTNQVWRLVHARGDLFQLVADHSGRCLDVAGVLAGNDVDIGQWDCLGTQQFNQLWRLSTRPRR